MGHHCSACVLYCGLFCEYCGHIVVGCIQLSIALFLCKVCVKSVQPSSMHCHYEINSMLRWFVCESLGLVLWGGLDNWWSWYCKSVKITNRIWLILVVLWNWSCGWCMVAECRCVCRSMGAAVPWLLVWCNISHCCETWWVVHVWRWCRYVGLLVSMCWLVRVHSLSRLTGCCWLLESGCTTYQLDRMYLKIILCLSLVFIVFVPELWWLELHHHGGQWLGQWHA